MFEIVKEVFLLWDPYGVVGFGPNNEYDDMVNYTLKIMSEGDDVSKLREYIRSIDILETLNSTKIDILIDLIVNLKRLIK